LSERQWHSAVLSIATSFRENPKSSSHCESRNRTLTDDSPADRRAGCGTCPAAGRSPDRCPCSGADQATADGALAGIIGVRASRKAQYQANTQTRPV
jgi:hypothetical protein